MLAEQFCPAALILAMACPALGLFDLPWFSLTCMAYPACPARPDLLCMLYPACPTRSHSPDHASNRASVHGA